MEFFKRLVLAKLQSISLKMCIYGVKATLISFSIINQNLMQHFSLKNTDLLHAQWALKP